MHPKALLDKEHRLPKAYKNMMELPSHQSVMLDALLCLQKACTHQGSYKVENYVRAWLNGNAMFYETLLKRNNKEIPAYLRDKQIECFTFNIIQQPRTSIQTKTFCFIEAEANECLMQYCAVV